MSLKMHCRFIRLQNIAGCDGEDANVKLFCSLQFLPEKKCRFNLNVISFQSYAGEEERILAGKGTSTVDNEVNF